MCTTATNFIYLPLKTPPLYTYVRKRQVISNLAVIPQTDPSPALITMANSCWFDDVVHIGIRLGTGNHKYTVCINSLKTASSLAASKLKTERPRSYCEEKYVEWHFRKTFKKDLKLSYQAGLAISKWARPSMKDLENGEWTEVQPSNPSNRWRQDRCPGGIKH